MREAEVSFERVERRCFRVCLILSRGKCVSQAFHLAHLLSSAFTSKHYERHHPHFMKAAQPLHPDTYNCSPFFMQDFHGR
ncbi:Hypothetical protein, putative [Bodo saltans]|uniref:Uncharacterized protein n=1 Tax=Bodo saltans TaxID=75058 RepID=A0A0S4JFY7_BODSA|nr:Hypothetical protein, putative [Bodo saltans]|eukprot:CUG89098.1 Hypothetical protein, putative [Bodo saltans]